MQPTQRLYYDDPFLLRFEAAVVAHAGNGGRPSIVLDRSAFYPEAGGQMADAGTLAEIGLVDVQVDDDGCVHHVLPDGGGRETSLAIGARVIGAIDRSRRRTNMALHTGQHLLSRALLECAGAETVSSRLGETTCTIDVVRADDAAGRTIDERTIADAETLANQLVDDDVVVRAYFPDPVELAALPLRRAPKVETQVRVVAIGDFDVSPCGGTHCTRSAQIGLVRVSGVERHKGGTRVVFSSGSRARRELWSHDETLRGLARTLTCGPADVGNALDRLRRDLESTRSALGISRIRHGELLAKELIAAASAAGLAHVVASFPEGGLELLRTVGARIVSTDESRVALLAADVDGGMAIAADRGAKSTFDCGAFIKRAAALGGGRGGGRPDHAEGRLPASVEWPSLVARALAPS